MRYTNIDVHTDDTRILMYVLMHINMCVSHYTCNTCKHSRVHPASPHPQTTCNPKHTHTHTKTHTNIHTWKNSCHDWYFPPKKTDPMQNERRHQCPVDFARSWLRALRVRPACRWLHWWMCVRERVVVWKSVWMGEWCAWARGCACTCTCATCLCVARDGRAAAHHMVTTKQMENLGGNHFFPPTLDMTYTDNMWKWDGDASAPDMRHTHEPDVPAKS